MLAIAVDLDEISAIGDAIEHRLLGIEVFAQLIEVRDVESSSSSDRSRVWRELSEQQTKQRRLPRAVRSDETDAVTARDRRTEIANDHSFAIGKVHVPRLDYQSA